MFHRSWLTRVAGGVRSPGIDKATRAALGGLTACVLLVVATPAQAEQDAIRPSVVKIHTTQRFPDFFRPWTKGAPREISGTGFIIDGKRIVTNAHVVAYPSQIYVQAFQSSERIPAKVLVVGAGIDLAILTVEDENFFTDRPPLAIDEALPKVKAAVNVYGYPIGGDQVSITEGIISRVEYTSYYLDTSGLRIQIDAAINPGNSGGPAISGDKIVGVAFSGLTNADNIGYLIPAEELRTFLEDTKDGKYEGKVRLWDEFQTTDNDALRAWLKLPKDIGGCMVTKTDNGSVAADTPASVLKEGDVVTKIGPYPLDRSGNVRVGDDLQVLFAYHVPKLAKNGAVPLTLVRQGETLEVQAPVSAHRPQLIPYLNGAYPSYFILGPVVYSTASRELLRGLLEQRSWLQFLSGRKSALITRAYDRPAFAGEELVIVPAPFFSHRLTKGYESPTLRVVEQVNGVPIKNLAHLAELLRDSKDEFIEIKFGGTEVETLVFKRQELIDSTEEILTDNGIRKQYSDDVEKVWEK